MSYRLQMATVGISSEVPSKSSSKNLLCNAPKRFWMLRSNFSADTSVDDHCQHLTFIHLPDASKCPNTMVLHFARICKHVIYSSAVYTTILYMSSCQSLKIFAAFTCGGLAIAFS